MLPWLGLAGVWLLVAGPIFQAALELREYAGVKERIREKARGVPMPPPVSLWWWLLPPVRFYLSRRRSERYFNQVFAELAPEDIRDFSLLFDKATGWNMVATGGVLLAAKETIAATVGIGLGRVVGAAITVVLAVACVLLARLRLAHSNEIAKGHQPQRRSD